MLAIDYHNYFLAIDYYNIVILIYDKITINIQIGIII